MTVHVSVGVSYDAIGGLWHGAIWHTDLGYPSYKGSGKTALGALLNVSVPAQHGSFVFHHLGSNLPEWTNALRHCEQTVINNPGLWSICDFSISGGKVPHVPSCTSGVFRSTLDPLLSLVFLDSQAPWAQPYITPQGMVAFPDPAAPPAATDDLGVGQDLLDLVTF